MSKTASNMLPLGTKAPDFNLFDTISQKNISLAQLKIDKGLVILFICNHCPYVIHLNKHIVEIANQYQAQGISFIAISSNDVNNYPQDGPKEMAQLASRENYPFPYLYDETQKIAKDYQAACTPDLYLFDKELLLKYRGQFDGSRPGNFLPVTGKDLKMAMDCLLNNKELDFTQKASLGCNIKWK